MNPVEILAIEHRLIRENLDLLDAAVKRLEAGGHPPRQLFADAVDFARSFTDAYHHGKEEEHLFVFLGLQSDDKARAQIEALRFEHELGRDLITRIANALPRYGDGEPRAVVEIIANLSAYIAILRHHIHVEDHIFFPLTRRTLGADEMGILTDDFRAIEERFGGTTFERCRSLVSDMTQLLAAS